MGVLVSGSRPQSQSHPDSNPPPCGVGVQKNGGSRLRRVPVIGIVTDPVRGTSDPHPGVSGPSTLTVRDEFVTSSSFPPSGDTNGWQPHARALTPTVRRRACDDQQDPEDPGAEDRDGG